MENKTSYSVGTGLLDILLIVFIVLKLVGVISWSWWIVLIPLWIELGIFIIGLIVIVIMVLSKRW